MKKYVIFFIATMLISACAKKSASQDAAAGEGPTSVTVWHAMGGRNGDLLNEIARKFNAKSPQYQVELVYKGNYIETMNSGISAFRSGSAPDVLMVFEVGTQSMIDSGAIIPASEIMKNAGEGFDINMFIQPVSGYYSGDNVLYSMPFNSSTPVLFYNKDIFRQAGLDPEDPPKTWLEVKQAADAIVNSGSPAGFTVSWPSWTMVENFSAWHGLPLASNNNGYDGNDSNLAMEVNKAPFIRMLDSLYQWSANNSFIYGGRRNESEKLFPSGQVAMIITSSAAYNSFSQADFELGIAQMPYWDDLDTAPQNSIIGGASFWVFSGRSASQEKTIAKFFQHMTSNEIQEDWHKATGYVPVVKSAYESLKDKGFYLENPGMEIAIKQLMNASPKPYTRGVRIGNLPQIRNVFYATLEDIVTGKKDAKAGLESYSAEAKKIIDDFVANSGN